MRFFVTCAQELGYNAPVMQVFLTLCLLFFAFAGSAAETPFLIDNIVADKAADTPTNARNLAIEDAQRQGFALIINRLTDANARRALPVLRSDELSSMVRSFEITDEKITGNRYQGRFNVFYDEQLVKDFLAQNKVEMLEIRTPPILVLPMLNDGAKVLLWEPENPWRSAWRQGVDPISGVNLILPLGEAADVEAITSADLKAQKFDALLRFANRYGAQEVLIADAFFVENGARLVVRLQPVGGTPTLIALKDYQQEFDASGDGFWEQAAASIQQKIVEQWTAGREQRLNNAGRVWQVVVALSAPTDWIEIRKRLEAVSAISKLTVRELSLKRAIVEISAKGSLSDFQESLATQQLVLLADGEQMVLMQQENAQ